MRFNMLASNTYALWRRATLVAIQLTIYTNLISRYESTMYQSPIGKVLS